MESTSSRNSTMNSNIITFDSVKDRVLSLLKENTHDEKELLACSEDLIKIPNLDDEFVSLPSQLVNIDTFEISHKRKVNPVFIRNILNIIQII